MGEVGVVGDVIEAVPLINVHTPVPTVGVFPKRVPLVPQTVWLALALASVGAGLTVTLKVYVGPTQEAGARLVGV